MTHINPNIDPVTFPTYTSEYGEAYYTEMREVFRLFDKDNDGIISPKELTNMMKILTVNNKMNEREIQDMVKYITDKFSGMDAIQFDDFCKLMQKRMVNTSSEEEVEAMFKFYDRDGDGFVGIEDYKLTMLSLNEELTDDQCAAIIDNADLDGDHQLSYEEFLRFIMDHFAHHSFDE